MSITIRDIAKKLNISVSTVSYALNGGPRPVPDRVRLDVLRTAQELNYRPNRNAKSLITKRTHTIGVIPSELGRDFSLGPYFHLALNGIINFAETIHQDVLLFTREDQRNAHELMNFLLDARVDGVIFIAPPMNSPTVRQVHQCGLPYVVLGNVQSDDIIGYDIDNSCGAIIAIDHLYDLGHRKIAHIAGRADHHDSISRREAFCLHMDCLELPIPDGYLAQGDFQIDSGLKIGLALLSRPDRPTAIFCANDEMAFGLMIAARKLGVDIPRDVSVIGFDDSPGCLSVFPALTTIRQPISQMASEAIRDLVQAIEGNKTLQSRLFEPVIAVRESTTCPQEDNVTHES